MAKSENLFRILELIRDDPNLTPDDLAKLCQVSKRNIFRYISTLAKMGISISFQDGGYKLKGDYSDILRGMDPERLESIKLLVSAGMRFYQDDRMLEHGGEFLELIEKNMPEREATEMDGIEILPEGVKSTRRGGIVTIGHSSKPAIINPILTDETISVTLMNLIFSSLVKLDGAQKPVPDLASSWQVSGDGLTWTFFIRDDVSFHDGHHLTAHDVEFTYRAMMDPENISPRAGRYHLIEGMEVEGDYVFRIHLKHPFAPFMSSLSWAVAPRHLLEDADLRSTGFNRHPVGSGPFRLAEWRDDDTIVLDASRGYFRRDRPVLDRLVFRTYPDRKAVLGAMARDRIDIALNPAVPDLLFVSRRGAFRTYTASGSFYYAVILNLSDPLFSDVRVRTALDLAVDKESIVENQLKGYGVICTGPFGISSWAYNPEVRPTPHDPGRARELLGQAGWEDTDGDGILDRDGIPLEFSLTVPGMSDVLEQLAMAVKAQLMEAGISVKLAYMDDSELHRTPFQAVVSMINAGADPDHASISWHSTNLASYENSFVDRMFQLGRRTVDLDARKSIYHRVHEMIHDDHPAIFLASASEHIVSRYQFSDDGFSSITHFVTSMRDWQMAVRGRGDAIGRQQEELEMLAN